MQNIQISRYKDPKATGWAGYIEPEDRSWIAFIGMDGRPLFFLHRDPVSGAILPDDPTEREAHLKLLTTERVDVPGVESQDDGGARRKGS